jgi:diacylglycerol kinase (ATP)
MKYYLFIVNPTSGSGKGLSIWNDVKKELDEMHIPYRSFITKSKGDAEAIASHMTSVNKQKIEAVIGVGGDGTFHEIVNGIRQTNDIPVCCIPAGSGNDFVRGFHTPTTLSKILHLMKMKKWIYTDIGFFKMNQSQKRKQFFINNVGVGFDAAVASAVDNSRFKAFFNRLNLGKISYVFALLNVLFRYKTKTFKLSIDEKTYHFNDVWLITIGNQPYYGGGMKIIPHASPTDGRLDVCVISGYSKWGILSLFLMVYKGWHTGLNGVTMLSGKSIRIDSAESVMVHADGEGKGSIQSLDVSVKEHSLKLVIDDVMKRGSI